MNEANVLLMPKLGLTMEEGVLSEWQVAPGDKVRAGQILFVVETDKLATEVEAAGDGEIIEIVAQAGETLPVGAVVARWTGAGPVTGNAPASDETRPSMAEPAPLAHPGSKGNERIVATPLARRTARQGGLELASIAGSGRNGRIKVADVDAALRQSPTSELREARTPPPPIGEHRAATPLEQTIARRLSESKRDIPHFYLAAEADASALLQLRRELNEDAGRSKLSVNHFIMAAVGRVWSERPEANRIWANDGFTSLPTVDVGFAVDTPRGLFAPVIVGAGSMPIDQLAAAADATAARARGGKLSAGDMSGGAVTVSNVGMYAITYLTPIINPGQSSILGVGTVRGVFRPDGAGNPALKQELGLVLACDHRIFNGVLAAQLLASIVSYLEAPLRLLRAPYLEGQ